MKLKRLDPRAVFMTICCLMVGALRAHALIILLGMSGLVGLSYGLAGVSLRRWGRNVLLVVWLLIFIGLGSLWGRVGSFHPGWRGLEQSLFPMLQLVILVGWGTLFGALVSASEMAAALDYFLSPLRKMGVAVQPLSVIVMLSLRFLPLLREEYQILVNAHIARGLDVTQGDVVTRLTQVRALSAPLWHNLLRRVDHITRAMEARAFRAQGERTGLYELRMTWRDYGVICGGVLIAWGASLRF